MVPGDAFLSPRSIHNPPICINSIKPKKLMLFLPKIAEKLSEVVIQASGRNLHSDVDWSSEVVPPFYAVHLHFALRKYPADWIHTVHKTDENSAICCLTKQISMRPWSDFRFRKFRMTCAVVLRLTPTITTVFLHKMVVSNRILVQSPRRSTSCKNWTQELRILLSLGCFPNQNRITDFELTYDAHAIHNQGIFVPEDGPETSRGSLISKEYLLQKLDMIGQEISSKSEN